MPTWVNMLKTSENAY